jgi:hypothetical protein
LAKSPPVELDGSSYIEQFFDPALLTTTIDGKTFNPNKEHEAAGEYPPTGQNPSRSGPARRSRLNREKHLDITFVVDDENKETHVLSPASRRALEIPLIASAALRHATLFSFRGSKRFCSTLRR